MTLLSIITHLKTWFPTNDGIVKAVNTVDFKIEDTEKLGLICETGKWKKQKILHDDEAWKIIRETTKNNPKINLDFAKGVLESCGCEITTVDTTIKTKINGFLGKVSGGQCSGHNYFMVCAEKR